MNIKQFAERYSNFLISAIQIAEAGSIQVTW
jgi:hypothetical protein